ncbi:MAG: hypothetical protein CK534_05140 [Nitrospirae bacterium]|nr:MAG: hypothetical protein CK534_05140 [Nitrospirota bacterium]
MPVGAWIKDVKQFIWQGQPDGFRCTATLYDEPHREERELILREVKERFCTISRGQKIGYVVDARFDEENEANIITLAQGAGLLYGELHLPGYRCRKSPHPLSCDRQTGRSHGSQGPRARLSCLSLLASGIQDRARPWSERHEKHFKESEEKPT